MQYALDRHGYAGIYAFMRLLEIMCENFNPENPTFFLFSKRYVFSNLFPRTSHKTGKKILSFFQDLDKYKYKIRGKEIIFNCSIIKELADKYTKKLMREKKKKRGHWKDIPWGHWKDIPYIS